MMKMYEHRIDDQFLGKPGKEFVPLENMGLDNS